MQETGTPEVSLDHVAICNQAIGTLERRGVCQWIERAELISEGCLALLQAAVVDEALGVVVARRAMVTAVRRNEVRQRGRQEVETANSRENSDGRAVPEGDQWDTVVYGRKYLSPAGRNYETWETIKALPSRQFQAVMLVFWGGKSTDQAAGEMGVCGQRVRQILGDAKKNIREALANRNVRAMTTMGGEKRPNMQA